MKRLEITIEAETVGAAEQALADFVETARVDGRSGEDTTDDGVRVQWRWVDEQPKAEPSADADCDLCAARKRRISAAILALQPKAATYSVSASDQGAGWLLTGVTLLDGTVINDGAAFAALELTTEEDLAWLKWGAYGDTGADDNLTIDVARPEGN